MLRFDQYPEPKWITGPHVVDALWLVITPVLAVGWWLARRQMKWASVGVLWLYGVLSMFVLGHYLYASPWELPFRINLLIGGEALAAALLILRSPFSIHDAGFVCSGTANSAGVGFHGMDLRKSGQRGTRVARRVRECAPAADNTG